MIVDRTRKEIYDFLEFLLDNCRNTLYNVPSQYVALNASWK